MLQFLIFLPGKEIIQSAFDSANGFIESDNKWRIFLKNLNCSFSKKSHEISEIFNFHSFRNSFAILWKQNRGSETNSRRFYPV
ncbi:MAG: hypothetical protein C0433_00380 [Cyclobacterium sp.]|nr:hypothetical protein [Cyclobacterium sp.]